MIENLEKNLILGANYATAKARKVCTLSSAMDELEKIFPLIIFNAHMGALNFKLGIHVIMKLFPILATLGVITLCSCNSTPSTVTVSHQVKVKATTPSHIAGEMQKELPHSGIFGRSMVRQIHLKPTKRGLKVVPEYNYGSPELDEKEYTRLYCVVDFNDTEESPATKKKELGKYLKDREIGINPIFLSEREYQLLPNKELKNSLLLKLREQFVPTGISGFHNNGVCTLLDAEQKTLLGKANYAVLLWSTPAEFLSFMTDSEPSPESSEQLIYQVNKADFSFSVIDSWAIINLPYTEAGKFMHYTYSLRLKKAEAEEKLTLPARTK